MNESIKFAQYIADNLYEENWKDVDGDGKTWVCMNDEGYELFYKREDFKRYTIEEIYNEFKKQKK
jgi:hypothetical protein